MPSFTKLKTVTASTKRSPAVASGKIGDRVVNIASLLCTPIDPLMASSTGGQPKFDEIPVLDSKVGLFMTYCDATHDIQQGDEFIVGSTSYTVKSVEDWVWKGTFYLQLILMKYRKP